MKKEKDMESLQRVIDYSKKMKLLNLGCHLNLNTKQWFTNRKGKYELLQHTLLQFCVYTYIGKIY